MPSKYSITTEGEEALGAATAETVLQLRGSTATKAAVAEVSVSFDGTTAGNAPAVVRLLRQSTDGTATAATEVPWDPDNPTANVTGHHSFSAEPTAGDVLATWEVHPQGGVLLVQWAPGEGPIVDNATSSRIGLEVTAPDVVNCVAYLAWWE